MRQVRISSINWSEVRGARAVVPVRVDWPELRLTSDQYFANTVARAAGIEEPYPDNSIFEVVIEYPLGVRDVA